MRLTLQDVFNTVYYNVVVNKMTLQNIDNQKQSSYEHLPYGCFIGMCLPEGLAKRLQEESLRIHVYKIYRLLNSSKCADNPVLKEVSDILPINCDEQLDALQIIHDFYSPSIWVNSLLAFAKLYNLTVPTFEETLNA